MERIYRLILAAAIAVCITAVSVWGEEVQLKADTLRYDPGTKKIIAAGQVQLIRKDGELHGDRGEGTVGGSRFFLRGGVWGRFPAENLAVKCSELVLITSGDSRILEGKGQVLVTRGENRLEAADITWHLGSDRQYLARGDVKGRFETHSIDADEVGRDKEALWSKAVRRYEDVKQGFSLSSKKINGRILGQEVVELVAEGDVSMRVTGRTGNPITITGKKGIYSKDRGTLVVSGGSRAVQGTRIIEAENLVLHLDTMRTEALGNPKVTFQIKE